MYIVFYKIKKVIDSMQLISNMLKCNISMHSFCGKIDASYFKMDGVKNIYKVRNNYSLAGQIKEPRIVY